MVNPVIEKIQERSHKQAERFKGVVFNPVAKRVKMALILVFVALILLDVALLVFDKPTISKIVLNSSPRFMVLIWIWGILSANFFLPRRSEDVKVPKWLGFVLLIGITAFLAFSGNKMYHGTLGCDAETAQPDIPKFTEVIGNSPENKDHTRYPNATCYYIQDHSSTVDFRYDLRQEAKLFLFLLGGFFGYFIWPQRLDKNEHEFRETKTVQ